jgi:uncharacterized protein
MHATMPRPEIRPRNLEFPLGDDVPNLWHGGDPYVTHFFDGLSIMFPEGEKFFMDAVRHFQGEVRDAKLREEVRAFCGQEGIHAREHRSYNEWLASRGYPVAFLEKIVGWRVALARKFSPKFQLAITCALEHFTAILADALLRDPRLVADMHPRMAELWRWHAIEETEHKAVAFDVYRIVAPGFGGWLRRVAAMWMVTLLFTSQIVLHQVVLERHDGVLWRIRGRGHALRYFWTEPGFLRRALRSYLSYYRPGFHPWQHDNADLVESWKAEAARA